MAMVQTQAIEAGAVPEMGIETCDSADGLSVFNRQGTELAVWRRTLPPLLRAWLEDGDPANLPD
ncbi:MAG: hypothetical protein OXT01_07020, partial [Rhodospirillaceae bacterium]|nr:hypothetical protein [Rhodospirillaceae bacterium]